MMPILTRFLYMLLGASILFFIYSIAIYKTNKKNSWHILGCNCGSGVHVKILKTARGWTMGCTKCRFITEPAESIEKVIELWNKNALEGEQQ